MRIAVLLSSCFLTFHSLAGLSGQERGVAATSLLEPIVDRMPVLFVKNRGLHPDEVRYFVTATDRSLFFTDRGITLVMTDRDRRWVVKIDFVDPNPAARPCGEDRQPTVVSWFKGPTRRGTTGMPTFGRIRYPNLWPGVDLIYREAEGRLKYDFVVRPGADPAVIRLRIRGATAVEITDQGALHIETPASDLREAPPVARQIVAGKPVPVDLSYRRVRDSSSDGVTVGFRVGPYDTTRPLVLDPLMLVFCGYLGGTGVDEAADVAVDASGNAYVVGTTSSPSSSFPVRTGPDLTYNGGQPYGDVFVAKIDPTGKNLLYCGYIGGAGWDFGCGIAVDGNGCAYVVGNTTSRETSFPVRNGPGLKFKGGPYPPQIEDAFIAKVNPSGTSLDYCGYIAGTGRDFAQAVAVDMQGHAFVTGWTQSSETSFPVRTGPYLKGFGISAFVARVNPSGTSFDFCGYVGGGMGDDIAIDGAGCAYITGWTLPPLQLPVQVGPDLTPNGNIDAFVAKVNPQGTGLVYCGYLGGVGAERGHGCAVDPQGRLYVVGHVTSDQATFPVKIGPDLTYNNGPMQMAYDAFVARVNATGTALDYCGYIGGSGDDKGLGITVDAAGHAYVIGGTKSDHLTFPVALGPDVTYNGPTYCAYEDYGDAFVANVHPTGSHLVWCGYVGGSSPECGMDIAYHASSHTLYLTGKTKSDARSFPVQRGPTSSHQGQYDGFVARLETRGTVRAMRGTTRPGGSVELLLEDPESPGYPYVAASSLGPGPQFLMSRRLDLSPDPVFFLSAGGHWPHVFIGYRGVLDAQGQSPCRINIPPVPLLIGKHIYTAFAVFDRTAPWCLRTISEPCSFPVTRW